MTEKFDAESFRHMLIERGGCTYDEELEKKQATSDKVLGINLEHLEFCIGNALCKHSRMSYDKAASWFGPEAFADEEKCADGETPTWFGAEDAENLRKNEKILHFRAYHQMSVLDADRKPISPLTCRVPIQWMVKNVIKPLTKAKKTPCLNVFFGLRQNDFPLVAPCTTFLSYTWLASYNAVLKSALQAVPRNSTELKDCYLWWDIFCQNQHELGNVKTTFSRAMDQVERLFFTIPELHKPLALGRIWCLFELATAVSIGVDVELASINMDTHPRLFHELEGLTWEDSIVDVHNAKATYPGDVQLVMRLVKEMIPGGLEVVNKRVKSVYGKMWSSKMYLASAKFGSVSGIKRALRSGVDVHYVGSDGWDALFLCSMCFDGEKAVSVLEALLAAGILEGIGKEAAASKLNNALASAVTPQIIKALLAAGADPCASPSVLYQHIESPECVEALVAAGADIHAKAPGYTSTPLEWAKERGLVDTVDLLKRLSAS